MAKDPPHFALVLALTLQQESYLFPDKTKTPAPKGRASSHYTAVRPTCSSGISESSCWSRSHANHPAHSTSQVLPGYVSPAPCPTQRPTDRTSRYSRSLPG